jgi:hypothetical protein
VVTDTELVEIMDKVSEYRELIEKWIKENRSELSSG